MNAEVTLDIRTDRQEVDHLGIGIGTDPLPMDDGSCDVVLLFQVLEHVGPDRIVNVYRECNWVLRSGGLIHIEFHHAGTLSANTDLTHWGTGGTNPSVKRHFTGESQRYWPQLDRVVEN